MRIRSVSLLATTLAALLGCPLEGMQASTSDDPASAERDEGAGLAFDNSEGHDDPIDAREDVSWVEASEMAQGSGALRVLMTDAPLDADNVFVTICGIYVEPAVRDGSADAVRGDEPTRPEPGAQDSAPREGTEPADRAEADDREESGEMVAPGAAPAAPVDDHPEDDAAMAADEGEQLTDEELEAERERIEAERERIEAEREAAEAEGRMPTPSDEGDRQTAPDRTGERPAGDGVDGAPPRDATDTSEQTTGAPRGWYTVSDQCQTVDLLSLQNGVTEAMGLALLPAGEYGRISLMLTEATIVKDGLRQRLEVPSGEQSGIKVVGGFSLFDGEATTITLDFDAGASVVYAEGRGFIMRPVIHLIDVKEHGQDGAPRDGAPNGDRTDPGRPEGAAGAPGRDATRPPPPPPPPAGTDPRKPPEGSEQQPPAPSEPDASPPGAAGAGGSSGSGGADGAGDTGA